MRWRKRSSAWHTDQWHVGKRARGMPAVQETGASWAHPGGTLSGVIHCRQGYMCLPSADAGTADVHEIPSTGWLLQTPVSLGLWAVAETGRQGRLRICWGNTREGSSPSPPTWRLPHAATARTDNVHGRTLWNVRARAGLDIPGPRLILTCTSLYCFTVFVPLASIHPLFRLNGLSRGAAQFTKRHAGSTRTGAIILKWPCVTPSGKRYERDSRHVVCPV